MTRTDHFDLVVLGSGPAGEKGAAQAAYFGKKVALVERARRVGGASVHTGTLPSKTLRETALYLTGFRRRELYGMSLRLDRKKSLRQLVGRLQDVTDRQTRQIERNLTRHGIALVGGAARFEDPNTVAVLDAKGRVTRRLSAHVFLIATGSSPSPPRGIGMQDPDIVDSDRILDLDRVPSGLTVVGGGVIGTEYACLFAALGTRVTLVEGRERLLAGVDEELSSALQLSLERMGAAVDSVERVPGLTTHALRLKLKSKRLLRADHRLPRAGGDLDGTGAGGDVSRLRHRLQDERVCFSALRDLLDTRDLDDRPVGTRAPGEGDPLRGLPGADREQRPRPDHRGCRGFHQDPLRPGDPEASLGARLRGARDGARTHPHVAAHLRRHNRRLHRRGLQLSDAGGELQVRRLRRPAEAGRRPGGRRRAGCPA